MSVRKQKIFSSKKKNHIKIFKARVLINLSVSLPVFPPVVSLEFLWSILLAYFIRETWKLSRNLVPLDMYKTISQSLLPTKNRGKRSYFTQFTTYCWTCTTFFGALCMAKRYSVKVSADLHKSRANTFSSVFSNNIKPYQDKRKKPLYGNGVVFLFALITKTQEFAAKWRMWALLRTWLLY